MNPKTSIYNLQVTWISVFLGGRHSSVVSSAPTILRSRVWIPSTPSTPFQFVLFKMQWEQNENKQKDAGIGITSLCYPPIIPCLGQGNSIPIFTYIISSIKSPTSTAHPNGFYWGHQCSWTLTPANNMQCFYIILLFILTLFYYLCCGFAILGLMGGVSADYLLLAFSWIWNLKRDVIKNWQIILAS